MNIIDIYDKLRSSIKTTLEAVSIKVSGVKQEVSECIQDEKLWAKAFNPVQSQFCSRGWSDSLIEQGLPITRISSVFLKTFSITPAEAIEWAVKIKSLRDFWYGSGKSQLSWLLSSTMFCSTKKIVLIRR